MLLTKIESYQMLPTYIISCMCRNDKRAEDVKNKTVIVDFDQIQQWFGVIWQPALVAELHIDEQFERRL